jgi:hypothetical protein
MSRLSKVAALKPLLPKVCAEWKQSCDPIRRALGLFGAPGRYRIWDAMPTAAAAA